MVKETFEGHRPSRNDQFANEVVEMIRATEAGDLSKLASLLARNPGLVDGDSASITENLQGSPRIYAWEELNFGVRNVPHFWPTGPFMFDLAHLAFPDYNNIELSALVRLKALFFKSNGYSWRVNDQGFQNLRRYAFAERKP